MFALFLIFIFGCSLICILLFLSCDELSEYTKTVRSLIILLDKKGYCPQQILTILSLYDSEFFEAKSTKSLYP